MGQVLGLRARLQEARRVNYIGVDYIICVRSATATRRGCTELRISVVILNLEVKMNRTSWLRWETIEPRSVTTVYTYL